MYLAIFLYFKSEIYKTWLILWDISIFKISNTLHVTFWRDYEKINRKRKNSGKLSWFKTVSPRVKVVWLIFRFILLRRASCFISCIVSQEYFLYSWFFIGNTRMSWKFCSFHKRQYKRYSNHTQTFYCF